MAKAISDNMVIYEAVRKVPAEALKKISGGRLNGMSDVNPMWRLKSLTEQFGVCGFGWKYVIKSQRLEKGSNDEVSAFVDIDLYIKMNGEWSDAIPGIGGSSFISKEKNGMYTSDECFKMALTDAIGISCKALGVAADVWFERDVTKYTQPEQEKGERQQAAPVNGISEAQVKRLFAIANAQGIDAKGVMKVVLHDYKKTAAEQLSKAEYEDICTRIQASKQSATGG